MPIRHQRRRFLGPSRHTDRYALLCIHGTSTACPLTYDQLNCNTGSVLVELQRKFSDHRCWMELSPVAYGGEKKEDLNEVPVYAVVKSVTGRDNPAHIEALEISYITLFGYNGHYNVAGLVRTGAHPGDIEHITARVEVGTGNLIAMWYNSHRSRDGEWVDAKNVLAGPSGRPLAFIALHGHGNYPRPGRYVRHFFLGNDLTSSTGPVWCPRTVVLLPPPSQHHECNVLERRRTLHCTPSRGCLFEDSYAPHSTAPTPTTTQHYYGIDVVTDDPCEWVFFTGNWGDVAAPICQSWFHQAETPVSRTTFQRLFLHLWPETTHM